MKANSTKHSHRNRANLLIVILVLFCSSNLLAQSSELVLLQNGQLTYTPFPMTGQTDSVNVVIDFSHAGYMGGGVALPNVPVVLTLSPSGGDDLTQIQNAIDQVEAMTPDSNGFRGAILLTAGDYQVSDLLLIEASGVVLRGEGQGSDGTVLHANRATQHDFIQVQGAGAGITLNTGTEQRITTPYVPLGTYSFDIANASGYSVGDLIAVRRTPNQAWIDALGMDQATLCGNDPDCSGWTTSSYTINHERIITAISGNTITVNLPITDVMEDQFGGGFVYKATIAGRIQNCGIENLRLESYFADATDEEHGWFAISLQRVVNSWVKNVTAQYFGTGVVKINDESNFNTVEETAMIDHRSRIAGARRYSFAINDGVGNLVQRCYTREGRHDYVLGARVAGPNVFVDCYSENTNSDIGPHQRWASGTLFDNIRGGAIRVQNRGGSGSGHGWAGNTTMFWNLGSYIEEIKVESPLGSINWGIGCVSESLTGAGYWESKNAPVTPRSLYYQQLEDRLGAQAVENVTIPEQRAGDIIHILSQWKGEGPLINSIIPSSFIEAVADTYIRGGENADDIYAGSLELSVRNNSPNESGSRKTYLKFDLGSVPGTQKLAKLRLFVSNSHPTSNHVSVLNDDSWDEATLTWNNAPAPGEVIDEREVAYVGSWAEYTITDYFNQEIQGDGILSVVLEEAFANGLVQYNSSESGKAPQILYVDDSVNIVPTAAFTHIKNIYNLQFDGSGSEDLDGALTAYDWDFGDGTTGSGVNVSHVYASLGSYTVTLTVTDEDANMATSVQEIAVDENAVLMVVEDAHVRGGTDVGTNYGLMGEMDVKRNSGSDGGTRYAFLKFDISGVLGEVETVKLRLSVNDNNGPASNHAVAVADDTWDELNIAWQSAPGLGRSLDVQSVPAIGEWIEYDITDYFNEEVSGGDGFLSLAIVDSAYSALAQYASKESGNGAQILYSLPAGGFQPTVLYSYTMTGLQVDFDGSASTDFEGPIANYLWDFGDGNSASTVSPTHTYAGTGIYHVTLTVTDSDGNTSSYAEEVAVFYGTPPVASFTYNSTYLSVNFDGSGSSDSDGTIVSYAWNFGDGNVDTEVAPTHVYSAAGDYIVTLTVTDDLGNQNAVQRTVSGLMDSEETILNVGESADFKVYPNPLAPNQTLHLAFSLKAAGKVSIYLFDVSGRVMKSQNYQLNEGAHKITMVSDELKVGSLYFFKASSGEFVKEGKIIVH